MLNVPFLPREIEIVPPGCDQEPIQSGIFGDRIGSTGDKDDKDDVGSHPVVQSGLRKY
jgi:hypothetical protein